MSTIAHFSLEHYQHMVEVGAFAGPFHKHVELIRGEIVEMTPIGIEHSNIVTLLTEWSYQVVPLQKFLVRSQNPIRLQINDSEPELDLVWVARHDYSQRHPGSQDVLLVVEVAGSSLAFDRGEKLAVYADAGIAEYWIVNLLDRQIEVYRDPSGSSYQAKTIHRGNEAVHPLALPEASLSPSRLFQR